MDANLHPATTAASSSPGAGSYLLHGLQLDVRADDPRLSAAVAELFPRYVVRGTRPSRPDDRLDCRLETVDVLTAAPSEATVMYHDLGLRYSAHGPRLFIEAGHLSVSTADLTARRLDIQVARSHVDSAWSIQHFAVLPMVMEFLRLRGLYPIHAAALEWQGAALILPALPGSGKSTLSIALVRAGLRLLSDDMPFLRGQGEDIEVLAFPEDINVCADGIGFFSELSYLQDRIPNERGKHSFAVDRLFPDSLAERGRPGWLIFPQIAHTPASSLEPMSQSEAFLTLLQHSLPPLNRALASAHFQTMMDTAASSRCYRLEVGQDPGEAASRLLGLLEAGTDAEVARTGTA